MKKAELLKLPILKATPSMMKAAEKDVLKSRHSGTYRGTGNGYECGMYIRCVVSRGILKAAFFLTEHMKTGGKLPSYELYISKKENRFITYDCLQKKWRNAKLDMICWPQYLTYSRWEYISEKDYMLIKHYLETKQGGYAGLLEYQLRVRADELKRKHRRETDPWDLDLAQTPALPKDWERWVMKEGVPERFIYYEYQRGGAKSGYCTYCEKTVPITNPKHNTEGICPVCKSKIKYKSIGRAGNVHTETYVVFLFQRCDVGFMIREFDACKTFHKGEYKTPYCHVSEVRRTIYSPEVKPLSSYFWGMYKQAQIRWIQMGLPSPSRRLYDHCGPVYRKTMKDLSRQELLKTGLPEFIGKANERYDPVRYLAVWKKIPQLEQFVKADLTALAKACLANAYSFCNVIKDPNASELLKALGIDSQQMKRLRNNDWREDHIIWLQHEKKTNRQIDDHIIDWFVQNNIPPEKVAFISDYMSPAQIHHYMIRQMKENQKQCREVLTTWADYLSMAKKLGFDTSDAIHYRVRKLFQRHQDLVELMNQKALELRAEEIRGKFAGIEEIMISLSGIYEYQDDEYAVVAPRKVDDVLLEGERLHHCVGSSDRYWERIETKESYIMFLRRTNDPETAFYTLEIEPDGTVRQKRTMYDRQNDDIADATRFLKKWQTVISDRLTDREFALAKKSKVLRLQEFKDLQENRVIINTGELRGSRLVDVLMADLMENPDVQQGTALPAAA